MFAWLFQEWQNPLNPFRWHRDANVALCFLAWFLDRPVLMGIYAILCFLYPIIFIVSFFSLFGLFGYFLGYFIAKIFMK